MNAHIVRWGCIVVLLVNFAGYLWAEEEPVELVVWSGESPHMEYVKELFEREHPGVTVVLGIPGWDESLRQNIVNSIMLGTAPDVIIGENYFQQFIEMDALVPLTDVIADLKDDLIPATYRAAQYGDDIYGVPSFTGVFGFERNCQVIEAAGLNCDEPPKTWNELLDHAKTITEHGQGDYYGYTLLGPYGMAVGSVFRIAPLLAQVDASLCRKNCTEPYFNDPKAVPVLEFVREIHQYTPPGLSFNPDENQVFSALMHGQSAYQIAGSWHPAWAADLECETCRYSPIPVTEGGKPASVLVANIIYAVLKQSKHQDLAIEWVKFLLREDVQDQIHPMIGFLPTRRSALMRLHAHTTAATQMFIDQLLYTPDLALLPQWREKPNEIWQVYNDMLADILTTNRAVKEIMDEAQHKAEDLLR